MITVKQQTAVVQFTRLKIQKKTLLNEQMTCWHSHDSSSILVVENCKRTQICISGWMSQWIIIFIAWDLFIFPIYRSCLLCFWFFFRILPFFWNKNKFCHLFHILVDKLNVASLTSTILLYQMNRFYFDSTTFQGIQQKLTIQMYRNDSVHWFEASQWL